MKKSIYFSELIRNYIDEVDDLVTDSEGKTVLQTRLNQKRREIDAILPMIEFSPEMVSVVFYDAFGFNSPETMRQIILSEPSDFIEWADLKNVLTVSKWAEPLIESSLKAAGGDAFLVSTAALEFLRTKDSSDIRDPEPRADEETGDDDEDGVDDLGEAGANWLVEQGFEAIDR